MKKLFGILTILLLLCIFAMGIYMYLTSNEEKKALNRVGRFPVLEFNCSESKIDRVYAYVNDVEFFNKDIPTVPVSNNKISLEFSKDIKSLKYNIFDNNNKVIQSGNLGNEIDLSDDIVSDKEYYLKVTGIYEDTEINYVVRVYKGNNYAEEHIRFAEDLSKKLINKESLGSYSTYFPNIRVDDNNFLQTDRMSGLKVLQYGKANLEVVEKMPTEIFALNYFMTSIVKKTLVKDENRYFEVREFFRVRDSGEKMFLVDYKRDFEEVYQGEIGNNGINLGVTNTENYIINNKDKIIFTKLNRLYEYDTISNEVKSVFVPKEDIVDAFLGDNDYTVKPLKVDNDGKVFYSVFGRMPIGEYEGNYGIAYIEYDNNKNENKILAFVKINQPKYAIENQAIKLLNYDNNNSLNFILFDKLYKMDRYGNITLDELDDEGESTYVSSDDGIQIAQKYDNKILIKYTDINTERIIDNTYGERYYLNPIAFRSGGDFVYTVVNKETGYIEMIVIVNSRNEVIKEYKSDYKIIGVEHNKSSIIIHRYDEKKGEKIEDDFLINSMNDTLSGSIVTKPDDKYGNILIINIPSGVKIEDTKKEKTADFVSNNEINIGELKASSDKYFSYAYGKPYKCYKDSMEGVKEISNFNGILRDHNGNIVWQKELHKPDLVIKGIPYAQAKDNASTGEACIKSLEQYYMLQDSYDINKSFDDNMKAIFKNSKYFNGISMEDLVYFSHKDRPVILKLEDDEYVILIGTTSGYATIMRPTKSGIDYLDIKSISDNYKISGYVMGE